MTMLFAALYKNFSDSLNTTLWLGYEFSHMHNYVYTPSPKIPLLALHCTGFHSFCCCLLWYTPLQWLFSSLLVGLVIFMDTSMKMAFVPEISVKSTKSSFQLFHYDYGAYYAIHWKHFLSDIFSLLCFAVLCIYVTSFSLLSCIMDS